MNNHDANFSLRSEKTRRVIVEPPAFFIRIGTYLILMFLLSVSLIVCLTPIMRHSLRFEVFDVLKDNSDVVIIVQPSHDFDIEVDMILEVALENPMTGRESSSEAIIRRVNTEDGTINRYITIRVDPIIHKDLIKGMYGILYFPRTTIINEILYK